MKKLSYWLWMPFLFIILYSVMVNKLFVFSWIEGMTVGAYTATLNNASGEEETFAVGDKVASVSGHKKGVEGTIVEFTEDGYLHVLYDVNIPAQHPPLLHQCAQTLSSVPPHWPGLAN